MSSVSFEHATANSYTGPVTLDPVTLDPVTLDPAETLERIAFLVERTGGPTFKANAFRTAASTVRMIEPALLAQAAAAGVLKDLPGLGATTASVVRDVVEGRTPDYLAELLGRVPDDNESGAKAEFQIPELTGAAAELRAALKGDCHLHTVWSDGADDLESMARAAIGLGHEYIAVTDHSPRLRVAHGLDLDRLRHQRFAIGALNERLDPFRLLTGVEVDIVADGALDHSAETLAACDLVVASIHSKLAEDPDAMTRRMVAAVSNPHVDVLGHCTGRLIASRKRAESRFDADAVFAAVATHDKALEINCRPERLDPPRRLLRQAIDAGCKLVISTDAHSVGQLAWQGFGCERAAELGVDPDQVVNTWPVDRLLSWAGARNSLQT